MTLLKKSPISTHILDTSLGLPAAGVIVRLETQASDHSWKHLSTEKTNSNGRIENFIGLPEEISQGLYRLTFETGGYFKALETDTFYPHITVVFQIKSLERPHHVPLLINPFGYSTYRGT